MHMGRRRWKNASYRLSSCRIVLGGGRMGLRAQCMQINDSYLLSYLEMSGLTGTVLNLGLDLLLWDVGWRCFLSHVL